MQKDAEDPECTFKPTINVRSSRLSPRRPAGSSPAPSPSATNSNGDAERSDSMSPRRRVTKLTESRAAEGGDIFGALHSLAAARTEKRLRLAEEARLEREKEEMVGCTFKPKFATSPRARQLSPEKDVLYSVLSPEERGSAQQSPRYELLYKYRRHQPKPPDKPSFTPSINARRAKSPRRGLPEGFPIPKDRFDELYMVGQQRLKRIERSYNEQVPDGMSPLPPSCLLPLLSFS